MEALHVPAISIVGMSLSILLSAGAPFALFFFIRRRYGKGVLPVLLGGAAFFLFAVVLEQLLHAVVLRPGPGGRAALMERPFWYMLYGALAAGVFEETARFVSFHILKKRCGGIATALKYGVGHGGAEAILIGAVSMISTLALSIMAGGALAAQLGEPVLAQARAIAQTQPALFFVAGLERLLALGIQISLSVLVYYAVYERRRLWLFPLAVLLHAMIDCPAVLMQAGVLKNVWLAEGVTAACMAALAALALALHKRLEPHEPALEPEQSQEQE